MLFKQSAKDYIQCAVSCVRSMNIYDLVFLFRKENRKDKPKANKNVDLWKGMEGTAESFEHSFLRFRFLNHRNVLHRQKTEV